MKRGLEIFFVAVVLALGCVDGTVLVPGDSVSHAELDTAQGTDDAPANTEDANINDRGMPDIPVSEEDVSDSDTLVADSVFSFLAMRTKTWRGPVYVWVELKGLKMNDFRLSWSDGRGPWNDASLCTDSDPLDMVRSSDKLRRFLLIWDSQRDYPNNSDQISLRAEIGAGADKKTIYTEAFSLRNALKDRLVLITFPIVEKGDAYEHSGNRLGVFKYSMEAHTLTEKEIVEVGESLEKPVFHPSGRFAFVPAGGKKVFPVRLPIGGKPVVDSPMVWDVTPADMVFSQGGRYLYFIGNGFKKNGGGLYRAEITYEEGLSKPVLLRGIDLSYNLDISGHYAWITQKGDKSGTVGLLSMPLWGEGVEYFYILDAGYSGKLRINGDNLLYLDEGLSKLRTYKKNSNGFSLISAPDMPSCNVFLQIPPNNIVATNWGDGRVEVFTMAEDASLTHTDTQKAGLADDMAWNFNANDPHVLVTATDYSGDARIYDYRIESGKALSSTFTSLGKDPKYSPEYIIFQP